MTKGKDELQGEKAGCAGGRETTQEAFGISWMRDDRGILPPLLLPSHPSSSQERIVESFDPVEGFAPAGATVHALSLTNLDGSASVFQTPSWVINPLQAVLSGKINLHLSFLEMKKLRLGSQPT